MRLSCAPLILTLVAGCSADSDDAPGEMLPEDIELGVVFERGRYTGFPECPAQDAVLVSVTLTAPPDVDIEDAYLL